MHMETATLSHGGFFELFSVDARDLRSLRVCPATGASAEDADPAVFPAYVRREPYHDPLHQRSAPRRLCYRRADCPTLIDFPTRVKRLAGTRVPL